MTTREENELLTRTGPGTPGGEWMRQYWHPIAVAEEVPHGGRPVPVRIMSEDLVLFRDEFGKLGLIQRGCPHRCTDLSFGRIEDGGLRCLYHGWLFDVKGNCLEMPAEPPESRYKEKVKARAYQVKEAGGLVFAYLGKGEAPELPDYEPLRVGEAHRISQRIVLNCNYLQALEGGFDPAHLSYLHRPLKPKDRRPIPGSENKSADNYYAGSRRPNLDFERTDYGVRIYSIRDDNEKKYVRITNYIAPDCVAIVGEEGRIGEGYSMHWHVPIDDTHNMRFDLIFNRARPIDKEWHRDRWTKVNGPNGERRTLENRYLQDPELMKTSNFTGMGDSFPIHDAFATESMGPIQDRTQENLATTDKILVGVRRLIMENIAKVQAGESPLHVVRDPAKRDMSHMVVVSQVTAKGEDHKQLWKTKVIPPQAAE
ncbi:MAG TPA: Rieske 2Fe-2S domain-containing protein [Alphaproteobacteria bacterium]|jgi:phthalate 4,5-dioxygenase oxygenase subunit|nr:Rieske 2Fe-2S domain-containing protein [Alphaproteobacteria bacterium]